MYCLDFYLLLFYINSNNYFKKVETRKIFLSVINLYDKEKFLQKIDEIIGRIHTIIQKMINN